MKRAHFSPTHVIQQKRSLFLDRSVTQRILLSALPSVPINFFSPYQYPFCILRSSKSRSSNQIRGAENTSDGGSVPLINGTNCFCHFALSATTISVEENIQWLCFY
ncbi:hypothetical protein NPIL_370731 [Nephila pilipes]|uniref:Uncharacterized protein n=1 Tax=Nephila pilipes TaxID=299642 RepID=A0A8X6PPD4_NEPPI|nr:hypothetical protein NPIL_370731 [Nephila pilipes]